MAAPEYVPTGLESAPRKGLPLPPPDGWEPGDDTHLGPRPGELGPSQPRGAGLGTPGPDQGFALRLARSFTGKLELAEGEREDDALHGAVLVALKRASLFGRAPVVHDIEAALRAWGYLDDAPAELVAVRRRAFEGAHSWHHYVDQRRIVDAVPDDLLRLRPAEIADRVRGDGWRTALALAVRD
jgi:hypothetical protein